MLTIFTSCYNQAQYLGQAIESVLGQTYDDFEYLLYDDCSTDYTYQVIEYYRKQDSRIRHIVCCRSEEKNGVGLIASHSQINMKGDAWVWAPADDILMPSLLETKVKLAKEKQDTVIYHDAMLINNLCQQFRGWHFDKSPDEFRRDIWDCSGIGFTGIYIPKTVFDKVGYFPTHLEFSEDFWWMLKAVVDGIDFYAINSILSVKRVLSASTTGMNVRDIPTQIAKVRHEIREYAEGIGK